MILIYIELASECRSAAEILSLLSTQQYSWCPRKRTFLPVSFSRVPLCNALHPEIVLKEDFLHNHYLPPSASAPVGKSPATTHSAPPRNCTLPEHDIVKFLLFCLFVRLIDCAKCRPTGLHTLVCAIIIGAINVIVCGTVAYFRWVHLMIIVDDRNEVNTVECKHKTHNCSTWMESPPCWLCYALSSHSWFVT